MSDLKNRYQTILNELENHFQNEEDQKFVTEKFQELSVMFMDVIDRLTSITDMKIKEVEEKQKEIENKISTVQKTVDGIENDIYEDDESYEFEIICPYCSHEFVTDIDNENNEEIQCPECHNIIELDWDGEDEDCGCCSHHCDCEECEDDCNYENYNDDDDEDM